MSKPLSGKSKPLSPGVRLSDQVAERLFVEIRAGRLVSGDKIPTEAALVERFSVSRTVVREAVSRLKSLDLVESRQGSGVYVKSRGFTPLSFDAKHAASKQAVVQMVEVRRALEAEVAALAAQRRTQTDIKRIRNAMADIDQAVLRNGDGVNEDVKFHRAIADAARNPFLIGTLEYLGQFLHLATRVTRANEARRTDFAKQVSGEHDHIVRAIAAGDATAARKAATQHMNNAIGRIEQADPAFWQQAGEALAQPLVSSFSSKDTKHLLI